MQFIIDKFNFNLKERHLRYIGYIINLITYYLLFSFNENLFKLNNLVLANLKEELRQ